MDPRLYNGSSIVVTGSVFIRQVCQIPFFSPVNRIPTDPFCCTMEVYGNRIRIPLHHIYFNKPIIKQSIHLETNKYHRKEKKCIV